MIKELPLQANGHRLPRDEEAVLVIWPADGDEEPHVALVTRCGWCGERPKFRVADDAVHVQDPCRYANGITTRVTLAVPSGKLVITDDLRPVYDWDREGVDYNTSIGQAQATETMAAQGCAYGPVGNSCPSLYRTGPDTYVIANAAEDDPAFPDSARLTTVCTDLWAYSCADLEDFAARGGDVARLGADEIVQTAPGEYRFTHHANEIGFDADACGTVIFAHIERIA